MRRAPVTFAAPLVALVCAAAFSSGPAPPPNVGPATTRPSAPPPPRVLVFTKTAGFRHASIPAGIAAFQTLGRENGFAVDATEDAARFSNEGLADYRAVVFLNTTGDVLNDEQQAHFERYIRGGGAFVGVHAASDTEFDWPWFGRLVGAYFAGHPPVQPAEIDVVDRVHLSTRHLPPRWKRTDEWYDFRSAPAPEVHILARLDESSYEGGAMDGNHPIAWCHEFDGGRAWYTAGGHTIESYGEPAFLQHLLGGVRWAIGVETVEPDEPD